MTVRDLIIALKHCPLDADVKFDDDHYDKSPYPKGFWPTIEYCTWKREGNIVRLAKYKD